ncbi:unnamed protein product [Tilletia laevis]|uniref:N-acetyltransferase domain-containing protein n=2 Tax=Tilletia TaxID=13289 RepID=A0A177UXJ1_9BASI|nr:hypothetical protein CF336_g7571 [Tilletia laevis]KAE8247487.1 hypothetical protein A4X03_0g7036 [Tilletia caries]KAE8188033.1 hypothetical protein CF335_g7001 [Tilletia laevis]CAD6891162.1 unnamed protein product [Tilletia caries]CAD6910219.1 unnamed protein product [Tilletia laevis]
MSAYGAITRTGPSSTTVTESSASLPSSLWPTRNPAIKLSIHQIPNLVSVQALSSDSEGGTLLEHLRSTFASTVEDGRTYPQEDVSGFRGEGTAFESYFFAADVFVGVLEDAESLPTLGPEIEGMEGRLIEAGGVTAPGALLEAARNGRTWKEAVAGFYYVKPNYPGRSSHICNGGFVVSPTQRGLSLGSTLGKSYLYYAPCLGFKASVFNLVYVNNGASVRIWDQLGFTRAGLIPKAGRLRCEGERGERGEEEYVDAIVFYKSFE